MEIGQYLAKLQDREYGIFILCHCPGPVSGSSRLDYATHTRRSSLSIDTGCQSFAVLDYVDDVTLLAELLHGLLFGYEP